MCCNFSCTLATFAFCMFGETKWPILNLKLLFLHPANVTIYLFWVHNYHLPWPPYQMIKWWMSTVVCWGFGSGWHCPSIRVLRYGAYGVGDNWVIGLLPSEEIKEFLLGPRENGLLCKRACPTHPHPSFLSCCVNSSGHTCSSHGSLLQDVVQAKGALTRDGRCPWTSKTR